MNVATNYVVFLTACGLTAAACSTRPTALPPSAPATTATRLAPSSPPQSASSVKDVLGDLHQWDAATSDSRRAAAEHVAARLTAFALLRLERFACGGQAHEMAIFRHAPTGMEFVLVPGGACELGSPPDEPGRDKWEPVRRTVTLDPFLICRTEVTQRVWTSVVGTNPSYFRGLDRPAHSVTWTMAADFCAKVGLSLPSEVQWERAARGGTTTAFYTGDDVATLQGFENVADRTLAPRARELGVWWLRSFALEIDDGYATVANVASFRPNAFGLFDMAGNVDEPCRDGWSGTEKPPDWSGRNPVAPATDNTRVVRGGSWEAQMEMLRSSSRRCVATGLASNAMGIRPVFDLPGD